MQREKRFISRIKKCFTIEHEPSRPKSKRKDITEVMGVQIFLTKY